MREDAIRRKGMAVTDRRATASIFLARDLAEPGLRTSLAVCLVGGVLFSEEAMLSDSNKGPIVKYERALSQRRLVYWTALAKRTNVQVHRLISNFGIPIMAMLHATPHRRQSPSVNFLCPCACSTSLSHPCPARLCMLFLIVRLEFEADGRPARRGQDPLAALGHRG